MVSPHQANQADRRQFLSKGAALAAAGSLISLPRIARGAHNRDQDQINIGLIGCGGRGTGAVLNAFAADSNTQVTALCDMFPDRIQKSAETIKKRAEGRFAVPEDHYFSGLDGYRQLIASDVDVVLLATPPYFRPQHVRAAVEAGKHLFVEKPVAVDPVGVRSIIKSCEIAEKKGLTVVSGLCWRYDVGVREMIDRIKSGEIGEIRAMEENYLAGTLWHRGENKDWSSLDYQLRNWLYYTWLSGDHIAEQHIHSLDKSLWLMEDIPPVSCYGVGGRLVRTAEKWGNVYDHFSCVFEWEDSDVKVFNACRQMAGCFNETEDHVIGTEGTARILKKRVVKNGKVTSYKRKQRADGDLGMYVNEHSALFASIRDSAPINNGLYMAYSTMMAIMGREAAYTGKKVTWKQMMESDMKLGPADITQASDYEASGVKTPQEAWED